MKEIEIKKKTVNSDESYWQQFGEYRVKTTFLKEGDTLEKLIKNMIQTEIERISIYSTKNK